MEIIDEGFNRYRSPEEESELDQLKLEAQSAYIHVRNGRIAVFVVAALTGIIGFFMYFTNNNFFDPNSEVPGALIAIFLLFTAVIFAALGYFAKSKPVLFLTIAVVVYIISAGLDAIDDPATLLKGIPVKILLVYYMIKGISGGMALKDLEQRASYLGASREELLG